MIVKLKKVLVISAILTFAGLLINPAYAADLTVTLNSQGGTGVADNVTTTTGSDLVNPGSPTRLGYTLTGWFTSPTGGNLVSFPYTHNQVANFTLYAQWNANPGIIHVVNIVVNDNLGTKTAADFEFTIKHFGTNIEASPFNITDVDGKYFTLEPGTYVVAAIATDGYLGDWSGVGIENGFIDLQPGQNITITRNTYDVGIAASANPTVEPTLDPTVDPMTEDGGTLPATSSNLFNALALGLLLSAAGALGFRKNSLNQ